MISLMPADTEFNVLAHRLPVSLAGAEPVSVTYPDDSGTPRVVTGDRTQVADVLARRGYHVAAHGLTRGEVREVWCQPSGMPDGPPAVWAIPDRRERDRWVFDSDLPAALARAGWSTGDLTAPDAASGVTPGETRSVGT